MTDRRQFLTDLVDAYSQADGADGVDWQHQLASVLTNKLHACPTTAKTRWWRTRSG